jgi:general secretion pathway protein D
MVFLRPTVLRNAESANSLTDNRYDYILGEQQKVKQSGTDLRDFGSPSLPPRQSWLPAAADKPAATQ